jgi:anion-transporting  ArsA/GET3 family ATPase
VRGLQGVKGTGEAASKSWATQKIVIVSGKGGVGKSLVAVGLARLLSESGKRVLLAEIGDTSYYKDFWNLASVGHDPTPSGRGFDLALWNGESCLREYVLFYLRMQRLYSLFFENKVMKSLIGVAPGLNEIAILGKITSGIRKVGPPMHYDTIVVDCYATGHALALLQAPKGMMEAIAFGPMGHHSREIEAVIENPALTGFVVATLPEEMPVVETLEFCQSLQSALGADAAVIANKIIELPVSPEELSALEQKDPEGLGEFAKYLGAKNDRQIEQLAVLKKSVPRLAEIKFFFSSDPDELVDQTREALREA